MYSVTFRVKVDNVLLELLRLLKIDMSSAFCNQIYDEFVMQGPLTQSIRDKIESFFANTKVHVKNQDSHVVYLYVPCSNPDESHLLLAKNSVLEHQGLLMSTYQVHNWQYYAVIIFGQSHLKNMKQQLNSNFDFELISQEEISHLDFITDQPYVKLKQILESLTDLQLSIIKSCIEQGYYEIPRKVSLIELAEDMNKSRSSIEKVFRSAENRIMDIIVPHLYVYLASKGVLRE